MRYTFNKEERLCSKKVITEVYEKGKSFSYYPIKVIWLETAIISKFPAQILFSVPKRNFKKAVHRNKLKRRMREAYRLLKSNLYASLEESNKSIAIMFVYISKEKIGFNEIEDKTKLIIERFKSQL